MNIILGKELKKVLIKQGAALTRVLVDGVEYVVVAVSQSKYDIRISNLGQKLVYGVKFLLFEKCIAVVMKIEDDPVTPCYFDHYLNPSKPNVVDLLTEIVKKNNFGLCAVNPAMECIHLSALPLTAESLLGLREICKSLPIAVEDEEFATMVREIQRELNPEQLWNYRENDS